MAGSNELWKACSNWLCDLAIITRTDSANMIEFASILRDGVLLCRLANLLVPNSIEPSQICKNTQQSQFFCVKNISLFLVVCSEKLRIDPEDLFEPSELYSMTGFHKVLNTLSVVSHTKEAILASSRARPFPEIASPSSAPHASLTMEDEETIYKSLKEEVDTIDPELTTYGHISRGEEEEKQSLYDHIVARRDSQRERDEWSSFVPTTKRDHCIKELLDTEQNYVEKALSMIVTKFYQPLKLSLSEADHKTIFMNILAINNLHTTFYADLRQAVLRTLNVRSSNGTSRPNSLVDNPQYIGSVFVHHKERFIVYGKYCTGLNESRDKIMELEKKDQKIAGRIMECTKSVHENQFKLQDLLCLPMQRVLKYKILLKELLKNTDIDSADKMAIEEGLEAMEDVNQYVNEMKRDAEAQLATEEIEKSITDLAMPAGVRLIDYGRLNWDGEVRMSESTSAQTNKVKPRYVFIFDKVLIICKANRNNTNTYKTAYILSELSADPNVTVEAKTGGTIGKRNTQYVIHIHRNKENADAIHLQFFFKNQAQRQKWLERFEIAKDNVQPMIAGSNHVVQFASFHVDTVPHLCSVCKMFLKGLYFQGYRCEVCKQEMHKGCIGHRRCEGRRPTERGSHSFSGTRPRIAVAKGDVVVSTMRFYPSDANYLSFEKDEKIEITNILNESLFSGFVLNNKARSGLVKVECIQRQRSPSMNGVSPSDSFNGFSSARIDRKESTQLPRRPDPVLRNSVGGRMQDYVNTDVSAQPWYMGEVDRHEAENKLRGTSNGTFLVRYSNNLRKSALSMSYDGIVKHMRIDQNKDGQYFLDEGYIFNSIVELITYYKENNLNEIFNELNTTLRNAYRECKVFRAIHDYTNTEMKYLSFNKGDIITLIDTIGEDRGWWKGEINKKEKDNQTVVKVGFFPLSYVREVLDGDDAL